MLVLPPRKRSSAWQWWCDDSALNVGVDAWRQASMNYNELKAASGNQLFGLAQQVANADPRESFFGATLGCGFLLLYGLLTNTIKSKVRGNDDRVTMATMFWHEYDGAHDRGLWTSIISLLLANPVRCRFTSHPPDPPCVHLLRTLGILCASVVYVCVFLVWGGRIWSLQRSYQSSRTREGQSTRLFLVL